MKRIIMLVVVAALAVAALSTTTALASGEHGHHDEGDHDAVVVQVCAGGLTFTAPNDAVTASALARGTAWLADLPLSSGGVATGLSLGGPPTSPNFVNIREVPLTAGACAPAGPQKPVFVPAPPRAVYCAGPGTVHPYSGKPIPQGSALDLVFGQPDTDPAWQGATPANYIRGGRTDGSDIGASCDAIPAGYSATGRKVDGTGLYNDRDHRVPGAIYAEYARI